LVAAVLGAAPVSQAATVNARERAQQARLRQGLRSGALTGREFVRLEAQEARIRAEELRYRHDDGHIGPRERADLQRDRPTEADRRSGRSLLSANRVNRSRPTLSRASHDQDRGSPHCWPG
jgi:hypothetical protein